MTPTAAPTSSRPMSAGEWATLLALSVLWGGSFFFTGVAVRALPPLTLVTLRVGLAAVILWGVLRATGQAMPRAPRIWTAFLGMGALNNVVPFSPIVWGQTHIASGLAAILNATTPLFTVLVAHALTRDERLTANRLAGVLVGFAGVVVMVGPGLLQGLGDAAAAQTAVLGAAVSYAFAGLYGRRFKALGVAPLATAAGQVTASTAMLLPVALLLERPWTLPLPSLPVWGAVLGIAALSTALAYVLYFRLLATAGATNLVLVTFLIPVSALILGVLALGETVEPRQLAGMALIGLGLACLDGRLLARLRRPPCPSPAQGLSASGRPEDAA